MAASPRATSLNVVTDEIRYGDQPRLLLKLDEAAKQLSVSKTKLYGLLRNDLLPSVLLGGQRYVAQADLVAFVDELRAAAQPFADTA